MPSLISSCRQWLLPGPCGCGRWCGFADHAPADCDGDAGHGSSQIHQALDIHLGVTAQVAFDGVIRVDMLAQGQGLGVRQIVHAARHVDVERFANGFGRSMADSGDIGEGDGNPLVGRDVDAGDTCQV